ncbi:hypothetical protein Tco_0525115 [Tanacetum coccineum]
MLVKNLLIPLTIKTKANANEFERALKQEIFDDLEYIQSLENEAEELESEKAEFSNEYDPLLQEYVSKDIMCVILCYFDNLHEYFEMACNYLEAIAKYLEVAFRKSTCFVRDLQGNDLLTGTHGYDLYTIAL